jgi:hypothetical protein
LAHGRARETGPARRSDSVHALHVRSHRGNRRTCSGTRPGCVRRRQAGGPPHDDRGDRDGPRPPVSHAAPGLEALLPGTIDGREGQRHRHYGARRHQRVRQRAEAALELEVGVFRVHGLAAPALRDAILRSSRPNAPGLAVARVSLGGRQVTRVAYPGGSTLYLYTYEDVVYYVGTQDEARAVHIFRRLH